MDTISARMGLVARKIDRIQARNITRKSVASVTVLLAQAEALRNMRRREAQAPFEKAGLL